MLSLLSHHLQVRISQVTTTGSTYGAVSRLSLYSSTGKILGLFGNPATAEKESVIKASKPGQSLTGFCTKVVAGANLPARVAEVTEASITDWSPPIQAAQLRITKVTAYYKPGDPDKTIVGILYTYSDGSTELVGYATSEKETKNVPAGQKLVKVESNQVSAINALLPVLGVFALLLSCNAELRKDVSTCCSTCNHCCSCAVGWTGAHQVQALCIAWHAQASFAELPE
jgi:hypothetical protein